MIWAKYLSIPQLVHTMLSVIMQQWYLRTGYQTLPGLQNTS